MRFSTNITTQMGGDKRGDLGPDDGVLDVPNILLPVVQAPETCFIMQEIATAGTSAIFGQSILAAGESVGVNGSDISTTVLRLSTGVWELSLVWGCESTGAVGGFLVADVRMFFNPPAAAGNFLIASHRVDTINSRSFGNTRFTLGVPQNNVLWFQSVVFNNGVNLGRMRLSVAANRLA